MNPAPVVILDAWREVRVRTRYAWAFDYLTGDLFEWGHVGTRVFRQVAKFVLIGRATS